MLQHAFSPYLPKSKAFKVINAILLKEQFRFEIKEKISKSPILFSVHVLHLTLRSGSVLPFSGMWCQTSQADSNIEQLRLFDTEIHMNLNG
jgi:hypothetical protein